MFVSHIIPSMMLMTVLADNSMSRNDRIVDASS